jgi:hypothetical protein
MSYVIWLDDAGVGPPTLFVWVRRRAGRGARQVRPKSGANGPVTILDEVADLRG